MEGRIRDVTSTRAMLEAPFSTPLNPGSPPVIYKHREKPTYMTSNPFSEHDNRHTIEGQADYLGNGRDTRHFGRRLHPIDRSQFHTDVTYLYHGFEHDYSPTTATTYRDPGLIQHLAHRRFPKVYRNDESSQSTTRIFDRRNTSYKTPLHVLAMSQQPLLSPNTWKYSFHGDYRVYPPYDSYKSTLAMRPATLR